MRSRTHLYKVKFWIEPYLSCVLATVGEPKVAVLANAGWMYSLSGEQGRSLCGMQLVLASFHSFEMGRWLLIQNSTINAIFIGR